EAVRSVIGEDDVEAPVRERNVLGRRMDQREVEARGRERLPRVLQLARRVVDPDRMCAEPGEQNRPLRRAATQLEDVLAGDFAEDPELALGELPHPPAWFGPADVL